MTRNNLLRNTEREVWLTHYTEILYSYRLFHRMLLSGIIMENEGIWE